MARRVLLGWLFSCDPLGAVQFSSPPAASDDTSAAELRPVLLAFLEKKNLKIIKKKYVKGDFLRL